MMISRRRAMMQNIANMPYIAFEHTIPANTAKNIEIGLSGEERYEVYVDWGDGHTQRFIGVWSVAHRYEATDAARVAMVVVTTKGTYISLSSCGIVSLDTSHHPELLTLSVNKNQLRTIDLSRNVALQKLNVEGNELTSIDLSCNTALRELNAAGNKLTSLDVSHNPNLQSLLLVRSTYTNSITELDISHNPQLTTLSCYMNSLNAIVGLDGLNRTIDNFQITTRTHKLTADFDLSHLRLSKYGQLTLATTGNVKVAANINRSRKYNDNSPSKSWGNWRIIANSIEVTFEDGFTTSDKAAYIHHLADIVQQEALYQYPQGNEWSDAASASYSFRDHYEDYLTLRNDSYYGITWSNFEANSFGGTAVVGYFSRSVLLDKGVYGDIYFQLTYAKDAQFCFGYFHRVCYGVIDAGHPRFLYSNGVLACSGTMEEIQTIEDEEQCTTTFKVNLPKPEYFPSNYGRFEIGVLESSYPQEDDPYVSKVTSIQVVEPATQSNDQQ